MKNLLDTIIGEAELEELYGIDIDAIASSESKYEYPYSSFGAYSRSMLRDELENEGPSISSTCGGQPVLTTLHVAMQYASLASHRLNYLSSLPKRQQAAQWNKRNSPEKIWFGIYRKNRLINVRNRMWKIVRTLKDPLLVIVCDWKKPGYGKAWPGNPTITLGKAWKAATGSCTTEKVITLIHETAHIRGAVLGGELRKKYGIKDAKNRAKRYPGIAIRTAENIGYYAVCRAWNNSDCRSLQGC